MRHTLLILVLSSIYNYSVAQFAIVNDKDGYVNVRGTKDLGENIKEKLDNDQFVYILESKDQWAYIFYMKNSAAAKNGFVYRDRLKVINELPAIPNTELRETDALFKKGTTEIEVSVKNFIKEEHQFSFYKENKDQIEYIDSLPYHGTDGEYPNTEYASINVNMGNRRMNIPDEALKNLFEISLQDTKVNYDETTDTIYIQSMNSDGAGAYEVIWRIVKGVFKDRYLASGF